MVDTEVTQSIEKYVCALYGRSKLHSVNEDRSSIFWDKYSKDKKVVELCMLPPCFGNLELHLKRSNYVAYIFRHANRLQLNLDQPSLHGWSETPFRWMDEYFPNDSHAVLITANEEESEDKQEEGDEVFFLRLNAHLTSMVWSVRAFHPRRGATHKVRMEKFIISGTCLSLITRH